MYIGSVDVRSKVFGAILRSSLYIEDVLWLWKPTRLSPSDKEGEQLSGVLFVLTPRRFRCSRLSVRTVLSPAPIILTDKRHY
jgi:hypothetical protein